MKNPWTGEDPDRGLLKLDQALEQVLERVTEGRLAAFEVIKGVWGELVGSETADRSRPVRLEKGVLTVEVADGSTASALRLQQSRIRSALEERLGHGQIAKIRFRVGRANTWS